jgi:hypothetical protein
MLVVRMAVMPPVTQMTTMLNWLLVTQMLSVVVPLHRRRNHLLQ